MAEVLKTGARFVLEVVTAVADAIGNRQNRNSFIALWGEQ